MQAAGWWGDRVIGLASSVGMRAAVKLGGEALVQLWESGSGRELLEK